MSVPTPILQYNLSDASVRGLLPSGYTPLAYIESTGTLYINTGWHTNSYPLKLETEIIWTAYSGEKDFFGNFGSDVSSSSNCFVCGVASNKTYQWGGSAFRSDTQPQIGEKIHFLFTYESASRTMVVNGVSKSTTVNAHTFLSHNSPIGVFSGAGNRNYCGVSAKMYYARIWSGNTLGVDLRPARRNSDGVIGMYDLVSRTFKTNSGSGTFIAGPELAVGKNGGKSLPEEYLLVEYLESSGHCYINTNIFPSSNTKAEITYLLHLKNSNWSPVLTSYGSGKIFALWFNASLCASGFGNEIYTNVSFNINTIYKSYNNANVWYLDGNTTIATHPNNSFTAGTTLPIWIFGYTDGRRSLGKIYNCKFWESGTLIRNYIPCFRKSDMKPGLFDVVNQVFYINLDSNGEFILGPTVTNYYSCEPNAGSGTLLGFYTNLSGIYDSSKGWVADFSTSSVEMSGLLTLLGTSTNFSFAVWFKRSSGGGWNTIWGCAGFELEGSRSGNATNLIIAYSWGLNSSGGIEYTLNEWHHLVMTRNTSESKFYLDGELKYTGSAGSIPNTALFLGAWKQHGSQSYLGQMTNMMLFNTALTAAQVKELYGG